MASHPWPGSGRITRRLLLVSILVATGGGCVSATEREADRFISTVHADPLYSWRPSWETTEQKDETTAGLGVAAETRTSVTRALKGNDLPQDAVTQATNYANSVGWLQSSSGLMNKYVVTGSVEVRMTLRIYVYDASQLIIDFTD